MTGAANRRRGADAERAVVAWLRRNGWPDARRYLAGDGRQPGDIDAWPGITIEVKDRSSSSWPTWCHQAVDEAGAKRVPVVVRRVRGEPDPGAWEARVPLAALPLPVPDDPDALVFCRRTRRWWHHTTFGAVAAAVRCGDACEQCGVPLVLGEDAHETRDDLVWCNRHCPDCNKETP